MSSFNKITIVGYLGRDPEIRYTPQGTAVCNVSVATTERRKNVAGEYEDHTTWFRVTLWNRQAELANEYLAKGRQVYIEGRLRQEEYTDREGNRRMSLEVNATEMQFLGRREDSAAACLSRCRARPDRGSGGSRETGSERIGQVGRRKVRSEPRKKRSPSKKPSVLKRTAFHFRMGRRISCSSSPGKKFFPGL